MLDGKRWKVDELDGKGWTVRCAIVEAETKAEARKFAAKLYGFDAERCACGALRKRRPLGLVEVTRSGGFR